MDRATASRLILQASIRTFNSVDDRDEILLIAKSLNERISSSNKKEIEKVTPEIIKEALLRVKSNKSDPFNCLKKMLRSIYVNIFQFYSKCISYTDTLVHA